jgi:hypothetical protein
MRAKQDGFFLTGDDRINGGHGFGYELSVTCYARGCMHLWIVGDGEPVYVGGQKTLVRLANYILDQAANNQRRGKP